MNKIYCIVLSLLIYTHPSLVGQERLYLPNSTTDSFQVIPQNPANSVPNRCVTMKKWAQQCTEYPESFTHLTKKVGQSAATQYEKSNHLAVIPIVVHVLHNVASGAIEGNNISEAQILSQISRLNKDYSGLNEDLADVSPVFLPIIATSTGIHFCLADTDPTGNPTNGITRTYTSKTSFDYLSDDAKFNATGGKDPWDPCQYINIWVTPAIYDSENALLLLGYAQFPELSPATDGIVVAHNYFGDNTGTANPTNSGAYYKGRTLTHEMGHFLGLFHPFPLLPDCSVDADLVDDTPFQEKPSLGCPATKFSCSSLDMVVNFMDFSNDECLLMFTQGQADRMEMILQSMPSRSCLLDATTSDCVFESNLEAAFFAGDTVICVGETITFVGQSGGIVDTWSWEFEGGSPATAIEPNASVTFSSPGTYSVNLTVEDDSGNTDADHRVGYITVLSETDCLAAACTDFIIGAPPLGGPFGTLNPLPCGASCSVPYSTSAEVFSNTAYGFTDLIAGSAYNFNICVGENAGTWEPMLTIAHLSGGSIGDIVAFQAGCSLDFTVPTDGNYVLVITEVGMCDGELPNDIPNGYLEATCLSAPDCDCDSDLYSIGPTSIVVCSDETFTLEVGGHTGTIYDATLQFWTAVYEKNLDGTWSNNLLGTQIPYGTPDLLAHTAYAGQVGNIFEGAFSNHTCEPRELFFYATFSRSNGDYYLDICRPYPYVEYKVTIMPPTQGFSIAEIEDCVFEFIPVCPSQTISPANFTSTGILDSTIVEISGPCGSFSSLIGFTDCIVDGIDTHQIRDMRLGFAIQTLTLAPAHQSMTMELRSVKPSALALRIYNINGQVITQQVIHTTGSTDFIDVGLLGYPTGIYLLQLANEKGVATKRFFVAAE